MKRGKKKTCLTNVGQRRSALARLLNMPLPVRMPLFALCGVAGYLTSKAFISPSLDGSSTPLKPPAAVARLVPATAADSSFIAEWETLRGTAPAGPDALPELYAGIKDIKDSFRRRAFRSALLAEWALTNPQAGLAYLCLLYTSPSPRD